MKNNPAIIVEGISKRYRVGKPNHEKGGWKSALSPLFSPFQYLVKTLREPSADEIFWALNDVSLDVQRGEVYGIIGRNGAGKSTLLKILSRITEPTRGRALIDGRVGSLLEVGTGFHPELTGRENIYLNGAILGMKKAETDRKFDEIVAFSEVENFIDTPVKRYSSGMYVRLAFSVAAHLEPEILLVDEVLAVGDISFQQKCLNRIKRLTESGMTILMVSHNMAAIQSSCQKVAFLDKGKLVRCGDPVEVIEAFRRAQQNRNENQRGALDEEIIHSSPESLVTIDGFEMLGPDGVSRREFDFGESIHIRISLDAKQRIDHPMINFGIKRGDGVVVCNYNNWYDNFKIDYIEGKCTLDGWLPPLRLVPEFYQAHVLIWRWGGGHLNTALDSTRPLAWSTFGDFLVKGIALNSNDGVFQSPAVKWHFQRDGTVLNSEKISENDIFLAFDE